MEVANEPVIEVQASAGIKMLPDYAHPEDYQIILKFKSGLLGHIWLNANLQLPIHKTDLEIYGEKGTIISDTSSQTLQIYQKGEENFTSREFPKEFSIPKVVQILNNLVKGKSPSYYPLPNINEAVSLIKILDSVEKSIQTGKFVSI